MLNRIVRPLYMYEHVHCLSMKRRTETYHCHNNIIDKTFDIL